MIFFDLLILIILLDSVVTYLALKFYRYVEINQFMNYFIQNFSLEGAMIGKFIISFIIILILIRIIKRYGLNPNFFGCWALLSYVTLYTMGLFVL